MDRTIVFIEKQCSHTAEGYVNTALSFLMILFGCTNLLSEVYALAFLNTVDNIVCNVVLGLYIYIKCLDSVCLALSLISFFN